MIIKLQIVKYKNIPPEEAELTIVDESIFSDNNDLIGYMNKYKGPQLGICILKLNSKKGGDAGEISENFDGVAFDIDSALTLYEYIKYPDNLLEDVIIDDEHLWGVSEQEFEEHLYQAMLPDDDPNKKD